MPDRARVSAFLILATIGALVAAAPADAQAPSELEVRCDAGDSLEAALASIETGGRILLRSGVCTGNFSITRTVRIQGEGLDRVTLQAADPARPVVQISAGITVKVQGITVRGGHIGVSTVGRIEMTFSTVADNTDAGIEIRDGGMLVTDRVLVTRNVGSGIRILNGEAAVSGSVISKNVTDRAGGAGVLVVGGRAEIAMTRFDENESVNDGGGLLATRKGIVVLDRVRFFRNTTRVGQGGAIALRGSTADITASSFFENAADTGNGGGIAVLDKSELRMTNTTLASNVASFSFPSSPGGSGGGMHVDKTSTASLVHATLVNNSARLAAGIASLNTVTMQATLLAGNLGAVEHGECGGSGKIASQGWNLVLDPGACRFIARPGDLLGASPLLGPYGTYGGAWNTVPLRSASPAIDRVPADLCRLAVDQRLRPRTTPAGKRCAIGAFERQPDDVIP
jgi:hypothetical protein